MFSEFTQGGGIYFVGIGGVSMSALALLLHAEGVPVRGSDLKESEYTEKLRAAGIRVHIGESEPISESTIVYTGAVTKGQSQIARAKGAQLIPRSVFLGRVAREFSHTVSVAGCHGKTTTTSMLSHIFRENGRKFACHIGGEDLDLSNCFSSGGEYFVTEACEFQRSFLALRSEVGIVLNIERDHTDCYADEREIFEAYAAFARRCRSVVVNEDDARARTIPHALSFGLYGGDIRAERLRAEGERYSFTVTERSLPLVRVKLNAVGKVHLYNALASFAAARLLGFSAEEIRLGLESFRGVKRRFERVGTFQGTPVVCDYAHHPSEMRATLRAAQNMTAGGVHLVFQPHTYTRTRDLMEDFVAVLQEAETPIVYQTFAAREPFEFAGSAVALCSKVPEAVYAQSPEQLRARLKELAAGKDDMILVLGAGDIYDIAKSILD